MTRAPDCQHPPAARESATSPSPATPGRGERLTNVDALRGFALLGILTVNIWAFASPYYGSGAHDPAFTSPLDTAVRFLVSLLFETKFYLFFAFLFGYSFTLQMDSADRDGASFRPRMLRRLLGLLLIGIVDAVFIWHGDILVTYAVFGLVLLACRGFAPERAIKAGIALWIVLAIVWLVIGIADWSSGRTTDPASVQETALTTTQAFQGSAGSVIGERIAQLPVWFGFIFLVQGPFALVMFLFGLAAGKRRLFEDVSRHAQLGRRIVRYGFPIGLLGSAVYAYGSMRHVGTGFETFGFVLGLVTAPLLSATYLVGMVALFRSSAGARVTQWLETPGRAALSNYMLQGIILGVIFTGFGLGLIGELSPVVVLLLVPVVFGLQVVISRWWLRGHVYGPDEWLLRAITKKSWPAWRRNPQRTVSDAGS